MLMSKPRKPRKMKRQPVDMKRFLARLEGDVEGTLEENLAWIAEETDAIAEWQLVQSVDDDTGQVLSFVVFTSVSGSFVTLPLTNDNVSNLIPVIISNTPDLDPASVPYIGDGKNFWRRYMWQLITFGVFVLILIGSTIASLIINAQSAGVTP